MAPVVSLLMAAVAVPLTLPVPAVIMLKPALITTPVTHKEPVSIVTRWYPHSPLVRYPGPIAFMPLITLSHWIPITANPHELGVGSGGWNGDHNRRWRWCANADSNGNIGAEC